MVVVACSDSIVRVVDLNHQKVGGVGVFWGEKKIWGGEKFMRERV